jgi:cytochrome c oxidase cbb3-type subunit 3
MPRAAGLLAALALAPLASGGCKRQPPDATAPAAATIELHETPVARGAALYATLCATCHGPGAHGYIADNAPSLRTATFLATATDEYLQAAILRGRPGTAMGAYDRATGGPVGPEEASAIIAFLRQGGPPPVTPPPLTSTPDAGRGQVVYEQYCRRCHGTKTQRVSAVHLANPILLQTATDAFLRYAVAHGRPPTSMAAWASTLTPQQIDDVVGYLRSLATPAPAFAGPPVAPGAPPAPAPPPLPPAAPHKGPVVINPKGHPPSFTLREDRYVPMDQVKKALDQKRRLIIADARGPAEWTSLHIKGAISTPYYDEKALDTIPNDGTWVIAYCGCPHHLSGDLVNALRKRGYKNTAVLDEGIFAWQQKGYPIVAAPGTTPPPAPPPPPAH